MSKHRSDREKYQVLNRWYQGHGAPVTRRDFISQGLVGSAAFIAAPTVLGLLAKSAWAANCDTVGGTMGAPAVLVIDHAGGAGLINQMIPRGKDNSLLTARAYQELGMPTGQDPLTGTNITNSTWGINYHANLSFVRELDRVAMAEAKQRTNSFAVLGQLGDDTSNNRINPASALAVLGAVGDTDRKVVSVVGSQSSESGGNSIPAVPAALYRAVEVNSAASAAELVSLGVLTQRLNNSPTLASRVLKAMRAMTANQIKKYSEQELATQAKDLVECGYLKGSDLALPSGTGTPSIDPRTNTNVTQVFDFTNNLEQRAGTLTYLLAHGFCGVATLVLGGRDYHDGTRATGEARDTEAARITAKSINLFHRLMMEPGARKRPLMIVHLTDGGLAIGRDDTTRNPIADANANGFFVWGSDRGSASAAYVFGYDPNGRPAVSRNQLGWSVAADGGVDRNSGTFAGNPVAFAEVFMANWLSLAKRSSGDIGKYMRQITQNAELTNVTVMSRA